MLVPGRSASALGLSLLVCLFAPAAATCQEVPASRVVLTCDRDAIDPGSYAMATIGQAHTLLEDRTGFWDRFRINSQIGALRDLNLDAQELAERAVRADPRNMMAHSLLARQYTIGWWQRPAIDAWRRVIDSNGVIVWTATLYDVDYKSYFVMSFGRNAVRIYRRGQFTGPVATSLGYAKFPEAAEIAFYEATAGCPDRSVTPVATIPWSNARELRSGNWVLWFKLARPVAIVSDRGKKKSLSEIKVNLHGATGEVTILAERNPDFEPGWGSDSEPWKNVLGIGLGPWDYNLRLRDMILQFADPQHHIKRTSTGRGAGCDGCERCDRCGGAHPSHPSHPATVRAQAAQARPRRPRRPVRACRVRSMAGQDPWSGGTP